MHGPQPPLANPRLASAIFDPYSHLTGLFWRRRRLADPAEKPFEPDQPRARAGARRHRRARHGGARGGAGYLADLNPEQRAGGRDAGRPGAGAGRRRHRQDAGADHPHRPHPRHRPGAAVRNPRRHLHQQGGARDEGPRRPDGRPGGRGHALARHLPRHRREDPAPPRRAGRAEERLHHPRRRRPDPAAQAACWRPSASTRSAGRRACWPG